MATKHSDERQDKPLIAGMIHKHESKLHAGEPKTKFAKGGVTSANMKKMGRNLARAMNQKTSSFGKGQH